MNKKKKQKNVEKFGKTKVNFFAKLKSLLKEYWKEILLVLGITLFSGCLVAGKLQTMGIALGSKKALLVFGILILLTIIFVFILYWAKKKAWKIEKIFLVCGLLMGTFYCFALPIATVPDEPAHFWRAYELSEGRLLKDENGDIYGPEAVRNTVEVWYSRSDGYRAEAENFNVTTEGSEMVPINGPADTYMPFNYIPQVVGVWIGKIFQMPLIPMVYVSRLLNMICCVVILYLCIKYIPMMKKLVFLIGFFPMVMQQFASVSADGSIICAGIGLITYVLYAMKKREKPIGFWDFALLLFMCVTLIMTKPVYVFLCPIVLWIPKKLFKNSNARKWGFLIGLGALTLLIMLIKTILVPAEGGRFGASESQMAFIIHEPITFLWMAFKNIVTSVIPQIGNIIGLDLEAFSVHIYTPYVLVLFVMFVLLCAERNDEIPSWMRIFALVSSVAMLVAVYASIFVIYSTPGSDIIEGVQGRYFLPFLLLAPMIFMPSRKSEKTQEKTIISPKYLYIITTLICMYAGIIVICSHIG